MKGTNEMENKKTQSIRFSTAVLMILILVLLGALVYFVLQNSKLKNNQVQNETKMQALQSKADQLEKTIEEIRNITTNTVTENIITDNQTSTSNTKTEENTLSDNKALTNNSRKKEIASSYISIINSIEKSEKNTYKYKLAYINEDDLPELIIDLPWYYTGIIMPNNDNLVIITNEYDSIKSSEAIIKNAKIDDLGLINLLGYGTSHRDGYVYVPKKNIIRCTIPDMDAEGNLTGHNEIYTITDNILKLKSDFKVSFTSDPSDEGKYYLDDKEISKERYEKYFKELGEQVSLEQDTLKAKNIIKELEKMRE